MEQVTLKFLRFHCLDRHHCAVEYQQLIDGIIRRFEEAYPHIKIESTIMRNWYQLMHTVSKKLPTDEAPDIFHISGGGILEALATKGLVYDLSQDLDSGWREDFVTASLHHLRCNGREYAVPLEQGFIFVWYNKKIFEEFGFSLPSNFDELLTICKELSPSEIVPFNMGNVEKWFGEFFFSYLFHRIGGDEVFVDDFTESPNYANIRESFIGAAEKILEIVDSGAFHEDFDTMNYQQQRQMFIQGKTAMWLNGNRLLGYIKMEGPEILEHLGIFPFPLVNEGKGKTSTVFGGSLATYAISEKSRHKEAAIAFLKALTDKHSARDIIYGMGDIPAMNHIPFNEYTSHIHGDLADELGRAEKILVHYFRYLPPHPAGIYLNAVAKLFTRDISPKEVFTAVEEALSHSPNKKVVQSEPYFTAESP
jgi:raffinose/stachyose/melibiose transport system substrate-binding protein